MIAAIVYVLGFFLGKGRKPNKILSETRTEPTECDGMSSEIQPSIVARRLAVFLAADANTAYFPANVFKTHT